MKRRILSSILSICLIFGMLPTAFADSDAAIAKFTDKEGKVTEFDTIDALEQALTPDDSLAPIIEKGTLQLLGDIEYPLGYGIGLGESGVLDLNNHTLTFVASESEEDIPDAYIGIQSSYSNENTKIINGTIVMDIANEEAICVAIYRVSGALALENVAILSPTGQSMMAALFVGAEGNDEGSNLILKNCTIDAGEGTSFWVVDDSDWNDNTDGSNIVIVSGNYKNLYTDSTLPSKTEIQTNSSTMTTNPTGVDEGTTVITSENTTAIIVENGNAYLYDTLQEAITAVENGRGSDGETPATITLLKDTEEEVTLKTDTKFNVSTSDSSITNGATYKTEDGYEVKTENGSVSVAPIAVTGVTLSPTTLELTVGGEAGNLTATVAPETVSQNVTWSSDNDGVATVSNGVVTAVAEGTATITATSDVDNSKTATCTVTVKPAAIPVPEITLSETSLSLREGKSEPLTYTVSPDTAVVTVRSSNEAVATAQFEGNTIKVTGVTVGNAAIEVVDGNGTVLASCAVTVFDPDAVVSLTKDFTSLTVGNTGSLTYTIDTDTTVVSVTSSDSSVTVESYGNGTVQIKAVKAGTATITITVQKAGETYAAFCEVTVSSGGGGGGGSSSTNYAVSTPSGVRNGTVSVSPKSAGKGDTVTVTVKPNSGYKVDQVVVTDKNGAAVKLTRKSDTQYTFTMPASQVTVEASFTRIETQSKISFVDVPASAYYYDAVAWAVENGITAGTSADTFSPDASCTRAQAVTFLWRAAGSPAPKSGANPFADVPAGAYYYDAVLWAMEQGITAGTSADTFSPDATCTRAQIVTFLYRAAETTASGHNPFVDVADSAYYAGAVKWAVAEGVTAGTSATTFSPDASCTRAQIVTFLYQSAK